MLLERLPTEDYIKDSAPHYVDSRGLSGLYEKIAFNSNVILVGPKGTGKSLSVAAFCASKGYPVVTFDCSEDVRRSQLIGMFVLRGNETPFILGPLPTAYEIANERGHCVLVLEELNALTPQMQKILNPVTDFRKGIEVPEAKAVFRLRTGARLWVVGTMNSASTYGGVYQVNEDLKSRFRMLPLEYPDAGTERQILEAVLTDKKLSLSDPHLVNRLLTLAKETRQGKMDYALSTRDLVQALEDVAMVGIDNALLMLSGKYEDAARVAFSKRAESLFGVAPSRIK